MNPEDPKVKVLKCENHPEGDYGKWELSLSSFEYLVPHEVIYQHRMSCKAFEKLWEFKIRLKEVKRDGTAIMSIFFLVQESSNLVDNVNLWLEIYDRSGNPIFPKLSFSGNRLNRLGTSCIIEETVEIASYPSMAYAIYQNVVVLITLSTCLHEYKTMATELRVLTSSSDTHSDSDDE